MRTATQTARIDTAGALTARSTNALPFEMSEGRYAVRLARTPKEVRSALRLRFEVFNVELGNRHPAAARSRLEFDGYDFKCRHLLVVERGTGETVGTYRLNSIETAKETHGFYSWNEFTIEALPAEVLRDGIEIGRACIAPAHRNTKVLFLLWKGLANYLKRSGKHYFFGCCSIFTGDETVGARAYHQLKTAGHFDNDLSVQPRKNAVDVTDSNPALGPAIELPALFNMYLRIGAKICSAPIIDRDFGTIDFFVVFDAAKMNDKYRKIFF